MALRPHVHVKVLSQTVCRRLGFCFLFFLDFLLGYRKNHLKSTCCDLFNQLVRHTNSSSLLLLFRHLFVPLLPLFILLLLCLMRI